ncbi:PIP5K6 [Symbiodinium sp. CCMP2592]|nr:PIP5K6 [Symbiodinium sp. CCMP2592]
MAESAGYDKVPDEWIRPKSWPPRRSPDAPHVVLSTKFQEPWKTISIGIKEILEELGCTVYNPNTDNKEVWKEEADSRWLLTFQENLDRIEKSKRGFVLQIQQGVIREKSYMQISEEKMGKKWQVPRMGLFAFATTKIRGGGTRCEEKLALAVKKATEQWEQGVKDDVQMVSEWHEPIAGDRELPLNDKGRIDGRARCTWPSGNVHEGDYENGLRHGTGTNTSAGGDVYVGEYKDDKKNGMGTHTYADGDVYVGEFKDGQKNGTGTHTYADGDVYVGEWKDGKKNGTGTHTYADGDVYVGEWKDSEQNGTGTHTYADGDVYVGEWKDGEENGTGTHTYADGEVYVGEWKDGEENGTGTHTYADGEVYVGEWKDGEKNGKGMYTYAGGEVEVGFYEEGEDKGRGVRLSADGKTAWLCMDGEEEREVSVAEARKLAEELGLPPLP